MIESSTSSIEHLVVHAQQGDSRELEQLLKRCYPGLLRLARSRIKDNDAAKDVVQETVIRVIENLSALRNPQAFTGWANQILNRCCCAHFNRQNRVRLGEQEIENLLLIDSVSTLEKPDDDACRGLLEAIEALGEKSRQVVRMHYFFGLSVKEIASRVRVSAGAVKVRLHRARKELKDQLAVQEMGI